MYLNGSFPKYTRPPNVAIEIKNWEKPAINKLDNYLKGTNFHGTNFHEIKFHEIYKLLLDCENYKPF